MDRWQRMQRRFADSIMNRCVMRPTRNEIEHAGVDRVEFEHSGSDVRTEAFVWRSGDSDAPPRDRRPPNHLVLKFPGTSGRAERSSSAPYHWIDPRVFGPKTSGDPSFHATEVGEVWTWNPPGYGRSTDRADLRTQPNFASDFARQVSAIRCGPQTSVWLAGNSLGCLSVLHLAANLDSWLFFGADPNRVGCWLRNPPDLSPVILRVARRYYGEEFMRRLVGHLPESLDAIANAQRSRLPTVFLTSELDTLVPPDFQSVIHRAHAGDQRVVLLDGLGHGSPVEDEHVPALREAAKWLAEKLISA